MPFAETLIDWYNHHHRPLPWRGTSNAYHIWLSEIILQQTRVEQGTPYYFAFVNAFDTVVDLANAPQEQVLRLWQGLGYYSRARNLHNTAKQIAEEYNGQFPTTYDELLKLKGIGPYTAGAIASFAYNQQAAAVDGNVYRFLARYFGIETPVPTEKARKEFTHLVLDLMADAPPGTFNQALIEFGALQCKPAAPACMLCPFGNSCVALQKGLVNTLPVKLKQAARRSRYLYYFIFTDGTNVLLHQRTEKDIWQGLFEFTLIENPTDIELTEINVAKTFGIKQKLNIQPLGQVTKHVLSHQDLFARFARVEVKKLPEIAGSKAVAINQLDHYALPRLITLFLENHPL